MATEKELSVIRFKKDGVCDINTEITLEDYKTDIKKLLWCKETVMTPSKFASKNGIELEGNVGYKVLYLGTDNRLYSTSFAEEYEISRKADSDTAGDNVNDLSAVWSEGASVRLLSPRKFSLRNKICSHSALTSSIEKEDCVTERFIPSECESQKHLLSTAGAISIGGEPIELADEYIPKSDTERIISSDCSLFISDVRADEGRISVRGELTVDILACDDDGFEMPYAIRRKLPFSQETEHPDVKKGCRISASGVCTELKVTPEDSRVLISAYCTLDYTVSCFAEESVCTDTFSPTSVLKLTENTLRYFGSAVPSNGSISISTSLPLSEVGASPSCNALTACGTAYVTEFSTNAESGKGIIFGECKFRVIFFDDTSEIPEYDAKDVAVPFRYEFPYDTCGEADLYCSNPTTSRITVRSDGEKLALDCELSLVFVAACECEIRVISDITAGEKKTRDGSCIRILYPQSGETLWSLAKSTSSRVKHICEVNGLPQNVPPSSEQSLASFRFIIV